MVSPRETGGRDHPTLVGGKAERDTALGAATGGDQPADEAEATAHRNEDPDKPATGEQYHEVEGGERTGASPRGDVGDPDRTRSHMSGQRAPEEGSSQRETERGT